MTEAEALELISMYVDIAVSSFSIYLTITFAYLTVAFFVGKSLSTFQAVAISSLYLIGAGSAIANLVIQLQAWGKIKELYTTILDEFFFWEAEFWLAYMPTLMIGGVLIGLYFMWNVRHQRVNNS